MPDNPFLNNGAPSQSRLPSEEGEQIMICHRDKAPCAGEACHLFEADDEGGGSCAEAESIHDRARVSAALSDLLETYGPRVIDLAISTGLLEKAMKSEVLASVLSTPPPEEV